MEVATPSCRRVRDRERERGRGRGRGRSEFELWLWWSVKSRSLQNDIVSQNERADGSHAQILKTGATTREEKVQAKGLWCLNRHRQPSRNNDKECVLWCGER